MVAFEDDQWLSDGEGLVDPAPDPESALKVPVHMYNYMPVFTIELCL